MYQLKLSFCKKQKQKNIGYSLKSPHFDIKKIMCAWVVVPKQEYS